MLIHVTMYCRIDYIKLHRYVGMCYTYGYITTLAVIIKLRRCLLLNLWSLTSAVIEHIHKVTNLYLFHLKQTQLNQSHNENIKFNKKANSMTLASAFSSSVTALLSKTPKRTNPLGNIHKFYSVPCLVSIYSMVSYSVGHRQLMVSGDNRAIIHQLTNNIHCSMWPA